MTRINQDIGNEEYNVTSLELFFDLVYAFALSQITEFLLLDLSWITLIKSFIIFGTVYMVWAYTSWIATTINADLSHSKVMILVVMILGFFMNTSIVHSFDSAKLIFLTLYLIIQFGRNIWTLIYLENKESKNHFKRVIIWQMFSLPFWIIGTYNFNIQIIMWLIAVLIDLIGTWLGHPIPLIKRRIDDIYFNNEHMLERCRLFRLIALGEMIFSVGDAIKKSHLSTLAILLGCVAMFEIIALWSLSFSRFVKIIAKHRKKETSVLISGYAVNVLGFILFAIILITIGMKYIILNPFAKVPTIVLFIVCSGPLVFLIAQGWYLYKVPKVYPKLYIRGGMILLFSNVLGLYLPAWIYHSITAVVLLLISYIDITKLENS